MKNYGLIGKSLQHSFSKKYFENKFYQESIKDSNYNLFELKNIEDFQSLIESTKNLIGVNVTIPYKESIIPFLNEVDARANEIGAVNTIKINPDTKQTKGYNTDYDGFKNSLKPFLENKHERALILGTGGASKSVIYVLKELNIDYLLVSRKPKKDNEIAYSDINEYVIKHHQVIINTTPVGTYPNVDDYPKISYNLLTDHHLLFDLIYNPDQTIFLKKGKDKGCLTINGLQMLKIQAEKAWEIWNT